MKKIMTAMGNDVLNLELRKYAKYDVVIEDQICQDYVISHLAKQKVDVLIISGLLQGRWNLEEFVEKLRDVNKTMRIIIVTDEIDDITRNLLGEYHVLDIFLDSTVEIQDIIDSIDREETIKKKYEMIAEQQEEYNTEAISGSENVKSSPTMKEKIIIEKAVQKQEVIVISGIPGSGKSTICTNLCKIMAHKSNSNILLIDLDTLNGNIDEILKINKVPNTIEMIMDQDKKSGLNYAAELIRKNRLDANVFGELVIHCNGFDVLTGNTSLHYCQNVLEEKHYQKILQVAKERYDFIIIDTSSNLFLDATKWALENATRILFVIENNYLSIKKMQQFLHVAVNIWGIFKDKIQLIVNKKIMNEVEEDAIFQITEGLNVIAEIKVGEEENVNCYDKILSHIHYIPKKNLLAKLVEMKKSMFVPNKIDKGVPVHAH